MEDTNPEVSKKIASIADEWTQHGNIHFDFSSDGPGGKCRNFTENDDSDVRVSFRYAGYSSLVGTDCKAPGVKNEPTLLLQDFDTNPPADPEFKRIVLHEFGHVIGFYHEHQHPISHCEDDFLWDDVYKALATPPPTGGTVRSLTVTSGS
jgi:hypothetical protein